MVQASVLAREVLASATSTLVAVVSLPSVPLQHVALLFSQGLLLPRQQGAASNHLKLQSELPEGWPPLTTIFNPTTTKLSCATDVQHVA